MSTEELNELKERAKMMGIPFSPRIGLDALREKVNAHMNDEPLPEETQSSEGNAATAKAIKGTRIETPQQRKVRQRRDAARLVRVVVSCLNPEKAKNKAEKFQASNSLVTESRVVPYNTPWHVPQILVNAIEDSEFVMQVEKENSQDGEMEPQLVKEYSVTVLPPLTDTELNTLKREQAQRTAI